jgi:hypothetical protein
VIGEINWLTGRAPLEEPPFQIYYRDISGKLTEITSTFSSSTQPNDHKNNASPLLVLPPQSHEQGKEFWYSLSVKCPPPTEYYHVWVGHYTSVGQVKHLIEKRGGPSER